MKISTAIFLMFVVLIYGVGLGYLWRMKQPVEVNLKKKVASLQEELEIKRAEANTYKMILNSNYVFVGKKKVK